ncbi:MAG: hypothetical protein A3K41_16195 [Chloroflexi bacterium RIFOXYD12_FULL_57_15]|nr:MAG: hypothetical protein A3K41_16195 [Chloroflexi bacterium RIFOXYD12_FULL_57_15]
MNGTVTIDASVFVNAFSPTEDGSEHSWNFITELKDNGTTILAPFLLLPEVTASIARKQDNTKLALKLMEEVRHLPNIKLINMDESLADLASKIAAENRLRGSDAVYAAVAKRFATVLITLDREQLERLPNILSVQKP